jgi:RND family efflux transporter MFP subunit
MVKAEVMKGKGLPGHAPVRISPEMQQLIGIKTAKVERRHLTKTIRTVGVIGYDETKLATMTMRYGGWIDNLFVNYTGQYIKKGEPLATVYSPDLLLAQHEYLVALGAVESAPPGARPGGLVTSQDIVAASREKLKLYDLTDAQIAELAKTRKPETYLPLYSPITGYVTKRNIVKRSYVEKGQDLYEIADLSEVWVMVDIYEYEIPQVKLGQDAIVELAYYPGEVFRGKVVFISPVLESTTRTIKVRLEFPNPDLKLKPMMYGNVTIPVDLGEQLVVDDSAVMFTGTEEIAFVSLGDGYFEPRKVKVGVRSENHYAILHGLKEGEQVVVAANFLVDSESRLKAAMMGMGEPSGEAQAGAAKDGMEGHKH